MYICRKGLITLVKAGSCRLFRKDSLRVRGGGVLFVNIFVLSQNFLSLNDSEELSFLKCDKKQLLILSHFLHLNSYYLCIHNQLEK